MKTCTKCDKTYPATAEYFSRNSGRKDGFTSRCKTCVIEYRKKYYKEHVDTLKERGRRYYREHPENYKEHAERIKRASKKYNKTHYKEIRERRIKYKYGITLEQYDEMFAVQDGVCAICGGVNPNNGRLCVDHDHTTGKVRGLLCQSCNSVIGYIKENIGVLLNMGVYLEKYKCQNLK